MTENNSRSFETKNWRNKKKSLLCFVFIASISDNLFLQFGLLFQGELEFYCD